MIDITRLYRDVVNTAKIGTSGTIKEEEFNDAVDAAQSSLIHFLAPLYAEKRAVKDLLAPFITTESFSSSPIDKPEDYVRLLSISTEEFPVREIDLTELKTIQSLPSRRPSDVLGRYYYYEHTNGGDDKFHVIPDTAEGTLSYIRQPDKAAIKLTPVSTEDSDYLEIESDGDLEWPDGAYNMIYYMVLDRLGVSQKEALMMEYSRYGLQQEAAKI